MDDRRALMAAIIANPDEDTPRLALADWLQEHGDEHDRARAEFIRLQIRAESLPVGNEQKACTAAATELERKHRETWLAPFAAVDEKLKLTPGDPGAAVFARGLLKYMFVETGKFLQKNYQGSMPDALAAVGLEELNFYSPTKRIKELAASSAFRWVARVRYPGADDAALAAFGGSPHFTHVNKLKLQEMTATDGGLKAFAKSSGTTRVRELALASGGGMTNARGKYTVVGLLAVLNSDRFPLLEALDLESGQPSKFAWPAFLADAGLKRLRKLRLSSGVPVSALASCPNLTALRELRINSARITDADADALLANPALAKLGKLDMYGMNWGHPRLSKPVEKRLRERFGKAVLKYSPEER